MHSFSRSGTWIRIGLGIEKIKIDTRRREIGHEP